MFVFLDSLVIARRDLLRSFRQTSGLCGAMVRPLLWLFLLGTALNGGFATLLGGVTLQQFIFPGIIAMNIAFAGVMSGASLIWDREFGFLKQVLVAPVPRSAVALGKLLGGAGVAFLHGLPVLALGPLIGLRFSVTQWLLAAVAMLLVALAVTSLGVLLAVRIESLEGFGTLQNLLVTPMVFLSGAMYPLENLPAWLRMLTAVNPLTYGVDLLRGATLGLRARYPLDLAVLLYFTAAAFWAAARRLEEDR